MKPRNISSALECYVKKGNKYLMLHRHPSKRIMPDVWMAPGGKIEQDEGLYECARREIKEETGLEIKNLKIRAVGYIYLEDLEQEMHVHFIFAEWKSGNVKAESDVGELVWLTPQQILKLPNLLSELKEVLPYIFADNHTLVSFKSRYSKGNTMISLEIETPD